MLIIDCHGHYTTAPHAHQQFRDEQLARLKDPSLSVPSPARISDDEIRETIENNQLKLQRERGADITIFSPRLFRSAKCVSVSFPGFTSTLLCLYAQARLNPGMGLPRSHCRSTVSSRHERQRRGA